MDKILYDIRTSKAAQKTLYDATGISFDVWKTTKKDSDELDDEFVERVIKEHSSSLVKFPNYSFAMIHVTTSKNNCASIQKSGLQNLKMVYQNPETELRQFLDEHSIRIDLKQKILSCANKEYNIEYSKKYYKVNTPEWFCQQVGRKFYYDYGVCGFLFYSGG